MKKGGVMVAGHHSGTDLTTDSTSSSRVSELNSTLSSASSTDASSGLTLGPSSISTTGFSRERAYRMISTPERETPEQMRRVAGNPMIGMSHPRMAICGVARMSKIVG